jgi:hypothetical protein
MQSIGTRPARLLARAIGFFLLLALPTAALVLSVADGAPFGDVALESVSLALYALIAGIVIFRRAGHPVGWLLLAVGAAVVSVSRSGTVSGLPEWVYPWSQSFGWTLVFALFAGITLVFPSGRLPGGTGFWALIGRVAGVWLPVALVISGLTKLTGGSESGVVNPIGVLPSWLWAPVWGSTLVVLVGGAVSLVFRRRAATGAERAQLGWVVLPLALLAAVVLGTAGVVTTLEMVRGGSVGDDAWIGVFIAMLTFPIAFGVAVLKYRLYEIDRIISRTLAYGLVTVVLAAVYLATVFVLGSALPSEGNLAVATSTLVSAALFSPLRRRAQNLVDRHFNRSRFDAQMTMEAMSRRLATEVDLGTLGAELRGFAFSTMQPETVAIWIRGPS